MKMIQCECTFTNSLMAGRKCDAVTDLVVPYWKNSNSHAECSFLLQLCQTLFFFLNNCIRPVNTHTHFYCPYCKARTTFILTLQEQLTGHHMFLNCRWQRDRQNYFKAPFVELFYHKQNQNHHKSCLLQAAQEQDKAAIHWRTSTSRRRPTGSSKTPITQPQTVLSAAVWQKISC